MFGRFVIKLIAGVYLMPVRLGRPQKRSNVRLHDKEWWTELCL